MADEGHFSNVTVIKYTQEEVPPEDPSLSSESSSSGESFSGFDRLQGSELTIGIGSSMDKDYRSEGCEDCEDCEREDWYISCYHNGKSKKSENLLDQLSDT